MVDVNDIYSDEFQDFINVIAKKHSALYRTQKHPPHRTCYRW